MPAGATLDTPRVGAPRRPVWPSIPPPDLGRQLISTRSVINDNVRRNAVEGDGRAYPDSSYGIWMPCNFNYHNDGGAEFDDDLVGFNAGGSANITITKSTDFAKFGVRSFKGIPNATGSVDFAQEATLSGSGTTGLTFTSSVWVYIPTGSELIGAAYQWAMLEIVGGFWNGNRPGLVTGTLVQGWQRLSCTGTLVANNIGNISCELSYTVTTTATVVYTDGWQLEPNRIATPYVETWPNNRLARDGAYLLAPTTDPITGATVLDPTRFWIAYRIRPEFDSTISAVEPSGTANPHLLSWMTAPNNEIRSQYELSSDTWLVRRLNDVTGVVVKSAAQSFVAGSAHTVIVGGTATQLMISVNGVDWVLNTATQHIPTGLPGTFAIGARQDTLDGWANSEYLWVLAGANPTTLNPTDAYLQSDVCPVAATGNPTFGWGADTDDWFVPARLPTHFSIAISLETDLAVALARNKTRAVGTSSEINSSVAVSKLKTRVVGLPIETNSVPATFNHIKSRSIGTSSEADLALTLARLKTKLLGISSGVNSAIAIARLKSRLLGISAETDSSLVIKRALRLGIASETDTAVTLGRVKSRAFVLVAETDLAPTLAHSKSRVVGISSEADVSLVLARFKSRLLNLASEADSAIRLTKVRPISLASETDLALALARVHSRLISIASETDGSQLVAGLKVQSVAVSSEIDSSLVFARTKSRLLGTGSEADVALALPRFKSKSAILASELDSSFALERAKLRIIAFGLEIDDSLSATKTGQHLVVAALEIDSAITLAKLKTKLVIAGSELSIAPGLNSSKYRIIATGLEIDLSAAFARNRNRAISLADEIDLARFINRPIKLGVAVESDLALIITAFGHIVRVPAPELELVDRASIWVSPGTGDVEIVSPANILLPPGTGDINAS